MSVDKKLVLIAEQVGLFLAPTLRAIAGAVVAESFGGLLARLDQSQMETAASRTAVESLYAALREEVASVRASQAELRGLVESVQRGVDAKDEANVAEFERLSVEVRTSRAATAEDVQGLASKVAGLETSYRRLNEQEFSFGNAMLTWENELAALRDLTLAGQEAALSKIDAVAEAASTRYASFAEQSQSVTEQIQEAVSGLRASVSALDAVSTAVADLPPPDLPPPDLTPLLDECRAIVAEQVSAAIPQVRESLAADIRDEVSKSVAAIPKAKDGDPGPAGLMGAVEPYVEGCVYERLAMVAHGGGTWQATRRTKTAPAANLGDWQAIAVGVSQVSAHASDDLRTVWVSAGLTDGTEHQNSVSVPAMVYRDVYDETEAYGQADVVTYAGSLWLALKETTGEQPSKSPDAWRLIVKRGQDGKPGKPGEDGVQFQAGFEGEYEEGRSYPKNAIATYASSIWMAKRPTKERPPYLTNADSDHWLRLR